MKEKRRKEQKIKKEKKMKKSRKQIENEIESGEREKKLKIN